MCVECYLAVVHPVTFLKYKPFRYKLFCSAAVWITALSSCLFCVFTAFKHINVYMCCFLLQFLLVLSVNLFCCVLFSGLWRNLDQEREGREKGGKPHEEKSVLSHSNNYCDHVHHVCACDYWRIFIFSFITRGSNIYILQPFMFHSGWFCAACSLSPPGRKTALPLLKLKLLNCSFFLPLQMN